MSFSFIRIFLIVVSVVLSFEIRRLDIIAQRQRKTFNAISKVLSENEFDALMDGCKASDKVHVVEYAKSKCKPCAKVAPKYEEMSNNYGDRVLFYKVDADTSPDVKVLMKTQGIRSVPTFHIWLKGEKVDVIQGARIDEVIDCVESCLRPTKE
mmetsp:Transcript_4624/g.4751  ORF Transcript_4624/g.4751 Transcript_4624/m.4751 type:complete len:153 (+) Transcript_4624:30-488(+)